MLLVYIYVALAAYNTGYLTLPMSSIETIIDEAANVATIDGKGSQGKSWTKPGAEGRPEHKTQGSGLDRKERKKAEKEKRREEKKRAREGVSRDWKAIWSTGTDACLDVPLGGVCEVLYGERRERGSDEEDFEMDGAFGCG